jgi:hypothetical protein
MRSVRFLLVGVVMCVAAQAESPVMSATAYGKVTFGERLEVVETRLNETAPLISDPDERLCRQIEFKAYPGVLFMIEEGRVTRAESSEPIATSIGFTVGSLMSEIKKKLPQIVVGPHHYTDGHYLTLKTKDGKAALVMEEGEGKITGVRGGLTPSVDYVEGCL